eukprot:SAG11_NODE_5070_length_1673_cov_2.507624_1_plen_137_part_00
MAVSSWMSLPRVPNIGSSTLGSSGDCYGGEICAKYFSGCALCQKNKIRRHANLTEAEPVKILGRNEDSYNIDFVTKFPTSGPQQHDMIMVAVDSFSQRVFAIPMHESATGADAAAAFYDDIVCRHGRGQPLNMYYS